MEETKKSDIEKLDAALDLMISAKSNMNQMFEGIDGIIRKTKRDLINLEQEKKELEEIKKEQEQKISGLTEEQHKLLKEYEQIKGELEKFTKTASGEDEIQLENIKDTLAIYRVLLEKIWQSQPHYKILKLLHGDAKVMTVDKLKNASGIAGAMILRACHDLAKVNLIEFDIDTKETQLTKRLFPKKKKRNQ